MMLATRLAAFAVTLYIVYSVSLFAAIVTYPATLFVQLWFAWQAAYLINRHVIQKRLFAPISGTNRAVLVTGELTEPMKWSDSYCYAGSNSGFGQGLVQQLAAQNFFVFACCRNPSSAQHLIENNNAGNIELVELDVTNDNDFIAARQAVEKTLRDKQLKLHAIVSNAGVGSHSFTGLVDRPDASDFEWVTALRLLNTTNNTTANR